MKKRRKFADGGVTNTAQQPTYPFYGNQPQAGGMNGGTNQTFNIQPQATAGMPEQQYKKGGQAKVGKVMSEFKAGKLKSSSGQKVTNPKQAIAIGLSEAGLSKKAKGGAMKESMKKVKEEVAFMKKKGAPKSMIKHEMAEAGMKYGGKVKKMASGGLAAGHKSADGIASKGKTKAMQVKMAHGGMTKKAYGGKC